MKKYFVVSDVHSFFTLLMNTLLFNGFDINNPNHILVICGDLFDRGNETVELFEFVQKLIRQKRCVYVRGNHEDLLLDCLKEIERGVYVSSHHKHNGTLKTIAAFMDCSEYDFICKSYDKDKFRSISEDIKNFIVHNTVDFAELDDYVFVHGWVPCYQGLESYKVASSEDWQQSRWDNGMEMWKNPRCRVEGKTVVCGHWHCSWGWSHLRQARKEFPQKSMKDWQKSFEPFIDEGIVAIDACTPYSEIVNCYVIESENTVCT